MTVIFMYHDVIDTRQGPKSGFYGAGAEIYKVRSSQFREHIQGLAGAFPGQRPGLQTGAPFALTFDDGGASGVDVVADILAERGWHAHFFVVTGLIGMPGFVSASGLRVLAAQGHTIGTHTVTHPRRLQALARAQIQREWHDSRARLADILGTSIACGSVPGGYASRAVRRTAAEAGLTLLLTSEPTTRCYRDGGLTVMGRFAVRTVDGTEAVVAVTRRALIRGTKALRWRALGVAKNALGPVYPPLREGWLRLRA